MSKLVLFMPDGNTLDVPLGRERTTIGRRADNDICLPDLAVSGEHAVVVTILADSFLEDLGSTNGTQVNGKAIGKHFLRDRDRIEIGHHKLVYVVDDDATMTAEVVGMARVMARDFGERVDTARPAERGLAGRTTRPEAAGAAAAPVAPAVSIGPAPVPQAAVPGAAAKPEPDAPPADSATPPLAPSAAIKVLSGLNAGVSIPLHKVQTTIGRPGLQVISIVKEGTSFRLTPVEGASPPAVNGKPVARDGIDLATGDVVEIAGTTVEFVITPGESVR